MHLKNFNRTSNIFLNTKLNNSNKDWLIKSGLGLASGLILFGTSQIINVKADVTPVSTEQNNTSDTTTQNAATTSGDSKSESTASNNTDSNQQNSQVSANQDQNQTASANSNGNNQLQSARSDTRNAVSQSIVSQPQTSAPQSTAAPVSTQQTSATSEVPADAQSLGTSKFYIDDNKVLHVTAGEYSSDEYAQKELNDASPFNYDANGNYHNDLYNEVSFDGKVIAHGTVANLFKNATTLTKIDNLDNLDTSDVTDFSGMFQGCSSLDSLDVSGLNTSNAVDMTSMFESAGNNSDFSINGINTWDTSNVYTMARMFYSSQVTGMLDLSNFTGDNLHSMAFMFSNSKKLTGIDLSKLNSHVLADTTNGPYGTNKAVENAFSNCPNLKEVDLSSFTGEKVNSFAFLFSGDTNLTSVKLPNLDTSSATSLASMFDADSSLMSDSLNFLNNLDVSKVIDFNNMFYNCTNLTALDLSKWNADNADDFSSMFYNCSNLASLKLPHFDDNKNSDELNFTNMISLCPKLNELDFTNFVVPENSTRDDMLNGTPNLLTLVLNNKVNLDGTSLDYVDKYKWWRNVDDPTGQYPTENKDGLMSLYSNNNGIDATWIIVERKMLDYTVKFVDYDTGADLGHDVNLSAFEDLPVTIGTPSNMGIDIDGYDGTVIYYENSDPSKPLSIKMPLYDPDAGPLVFEIGVKKAKKFTFTISDLSKPISIPIHSQSAIDNNVDLQNLDNTKKLDPDLTKINLNGTELPLTDLNSMLAGQISPIDTVKNLVDLLILQMEDPGQGISESGCIDINVSYLNDSSDTESSTNVSNRTIKNISQTVATFSDKPDVQLYDFDGNIIAGKKLGTNTDWKNDQEMILNGITYYRVSTDEWVKASDVYVYVEHISKIRTYKEKFVQLNDAHLNSTNMLDPSTDWKTDRYAIINGKNYYRVSTDEFVPVDKVYEYQDSTQVVHSKRSTPIYDERGQNVGHTLKSDQDYKTDKTININNETYYRVSTNEFVKKDDVM